MLRPSESASRGDVGWIDARVERGELGARLGGTREQLFVGLRAEASLRVGDALEAGLDLLEPARLGAERGEKRAKLRSRLAQAELDVTQLVAGARELGRERLERRHRSLGACRQRRGAVAFLGRERLCRGGGAGDELLEAEQPLALRAQILLGAGLEAFGRLDERAKLLHSLGRARRALEQLLVSAPRGASSRHAVRSSARSSPAPANASSTSSWNAGRASRRCWNWPDIAIAPSAAAATSSRAAARPHA